jgi:outer membrane receptor protein involved in Fe transport
MFRFGAESFKQTGRAQNQSVIALPNSKTALALKVFVDDISAATTGMQRWFDAGGVKVPTQHTWLPDQMYDAAFLTAQGSYLSERVHTVLSLRRDKAKQRSYQIYTVPLGGSASNDPKVLIDDATYVAWTPLVSVSAEPVRGISLYYNHSESFGFTQSGAPLLNYSGTVLDNASTAIAEGRFDPAHAQGPAPPPETGVGYEFGVKVSMWEGRLSATLASYRNTRQNIRVVWPSNYIHDLFPTGDPLGIQQFSTRGVTQQAHGWELDVQASPTENLTLAFGYTEPQVAYTSNPIDPTTIGVPSTFFKSTFNFLGRYRIARGIAKGLYVGTSVQYRGPYLLATNLGRVYAAPYTVWNPFLGYDWRPKGRWSFDARLDVHNVFDSPYVVSQMIGEPRGVYLSGTIRFK